MTLLDSTTSTIARTADATGAAALDIAETVGGFAEDAIRAVPGVPDKSGARGRVASIVLGLLVIAAIAKIVQRKKASADTSSPVTHMDERHRKAA